MATKYQTRKIYAEAITNNKGGQKDLIAGSNVHKNPLSSLFLLCSLVLVRVPFSSCFPGGDFLKNIARIAKLLYLKSEL